MARSTSLAALAFLLVACGAPRAPVPPPPVASSTPIASSPPPPPPPREDPRIVRCGIDDRPRPLSVAPLLDEPLGETRALRETSGMERAKPMMPPRPLPTPTAPPSPPPPQGDVAPPDSQQPPFPRVRIALEDPRLSYGPVPASVTGGFRDAASLDVCEPLAQESDVGHYVLALAMASSGRPTEVRSDSGGLPSRFLRCAMERACQVTAGDDARGRDLFLPFSVAWEQPPPPPPPPPPPETTAHVDAKADPPSDDVAVQLAAATLPNARRCTAGKAIAASSTVSLTFTLEALASPRRPRPGFPNGGPTGIAVLPRSRVTSITSVGTKGRMDREIVACIVSAMSSTTFAGRTTGSHRVTVTWAP